jgi:hypothetical protein
MAKHGKEGSPEEEASESKAEARREGDKPRDSMARLHMDHVKEHFGAGGVVHHQDHVREHAAGHELHQDYTEGLCRGGKV